jgi:hypothetical protein
MGQKGVERVEGGRGGKRWGRRRGKDTEYNEKCGSKHIYPK